MAKEHVLLLIKKFPPSFSVANRYFRCIPPLLTLAARASICMCGTEWRILGALYKIGLPLSCNHIFLWPHSASIANRPTNDQWLAPVAPVSFSVSIHTHTHIRACICVYMCPLDLIHLTRTMLLEPPARGTRALLRDLDTLKRKIKLAFGHLKEQNSCCSSYLFTKRISKNAERQQACS